MNEAETYEFDLNGFIVYRDMIAPDDLRDMNEIMDAHQHEGQRAHHGFMDFDPIFLELMAHPRTLNIIRTIIGNWLRLDHAYAIELTKDTEVKENLHGGLRADQGEHQYQWAYGKMWNGLIVVMYALEDVNPGDGGFICVPGSHKANTDYKPSVCSHLVVNPNLKAGDMLIFTEALVHGTRKWESDKRRRSLLYKYSPGYSTWANPNDPKKYEAMATTQLQRDLLRPPYVGNRTPIDFPEVEGATS
ncbi:MAG: phytanoyl-CoA dioxygenase family protein [Candidatus Latescibacterota bacterium]|nr:phytanoyl-CoA dioxygenase family protein [Candidatus Latescibacterota bacterium]